MRNLIRREAAQKLHGGCLSSMRFQRLAEAHRFAVVRKAPGNGRCVPACCFGLCRYRLGLQQHAGEAWGPIPTPGWRTI